MQPCVGRGGGGEGREGVSDIYQQQNRSKYQKESTFNGGDN